MKDRRPWRDPRPHAWGNRYTVVLLILVGVALFVLYRQFPGEAPEGLTVGEPMPADARLSEAHRPVADPVRERVLRGLIQLRARYRPLRTDILVLAGDDAPVTSTVVETLNRWLTTHQLRADSRAQFAVTEAGGPVQLVHAPQQEAYARHFAETLAPYLNATVELLDDPGLPPGALRLIIHRAPRFDEDGRAFFQ